jgi:hypothetical protein
MVRLEDRIIASTCRFLTNGVSMAGSPVRSALTIVMDLLVVVAVIVVLRVVIEFFGTLSAEAWGKSVLGATRILVVPFHIKRIATPYGGSFDFDASLTVLLLLAVEWALGNARRAS